MPLHFVATIDGIPSPTIPTNIPTPSQALTCKLAYVPPACSVSYADAMGAGFLVFHATYIVLTLLLMTISVLQACSYRRLSCCHPVRVTMSLVTISACTFVLRSIDPYGWHGWMPKLAQDTCFDLSTVVTMNVVVVTVFNWITEISRKSGRVRLSKHMQQMTYLLHVVIWLFWGCTLVGGRLDIAVPVWGWAVIKVAGLILLMYTLIVFELRYGVVLFCLLQQTRIVEDTSGSEGGSNASALASSHATREIVRIRRLLFFLTNSIILQISAIVFCMILASDTLQSGENNERALPTGAFLFWNAVMDSFQYGACILIMWFLHSTSARALTSEGCCTRAWMCCLNCCLSNAPKVTTLASIPPNHDSASQIGRPPVHAALSARAIPKHFPPYSSVPQEDLYRGGEVREGRGGKASPPPENEWRTSDDRVGRRLHESVVTTSPTPRRGGELLATVADIGEARDSRPSSDTLPAIDFHSSVIRQQSSYGWTRPKDTGFMGLAPNHAGPNGRRLPGPMAPVRRQSTAAPGPSRRRNPNAPANRRSLSLAAADGSTWRRPSQVMPSGEAGLLKKQLSDLEETGEESGTGSEFANPALYRSKSAGTRATKAAGDNAHGFFRPVLPSLAAVPRANRTANLNRLHVV